MDYDQTAIPAAYDAGRSYAPAVLELWLGKLDSVIRTQRIDNILDLGCGTGRYSATLSDHFGAEVVAVDPSEKMLSEARRKQTARVRFLRGSGRLCRSATTRSIWCSYRWSFTTSMILRA